MGGLGGCVCVCGGGGWDCRVQVEGECHGLIVYFINPRESLNRPLTILFPHQAVAQFQKQSLAQRRQQLYSQLLAILSWIHTTLSSIMFLMVLEHNYH